MNDAPGVSLSVYAVIRRGSRALLVRDRYRAGWKLPGGLVGPAELICDALRREIKEELNLEIRPRGLVLVSNWLKKGTAMARVRIYMAADRPRGDLKFKDGEVAAARWFTRAELGRLERKDFLLPQHYFEAVQAYLRTPGASVRLRCRPGTARHDIMFEE